MKRILSMLLVASTILILISGCGAKPENPANGNDPSTPVNLSAEELLNASWEEIEAQAKREGKVTFSAWSDEAFFVSVANAFEAKYGIKVEVVITDQNKLIDKALAEKDGAKGSLDLTMASAISVSTYIPANLVIGPLVPMMRTSDKLEPLLCERVEGFETNGYFVPAKTNQTGFLYNPKTVPNPPKTWAEFEKWIDENPMKFGFCIPDKGGSGQAFVHTLIDQLCGGLDKYNNDSELDSTKTQEWNKVWDWMNSRKDKITLTTSNNDSIARLNQGELDIVVAWDDNAYRVMSNGELFKDAKLYIPEFGLPGGGDILGIFKNAQHPAAALLLLDFMVSDEGQQMFIDVLKCGTARIDMLNPNTFLNQDDMKYRIPWMPTHYKQQYIKDFTEKVMMSK